MERLKKVALDIKQKLTKSESEKLIIEIINSQESLSKESLYIIVEKCKAHENCKDVMKILAENLRSDHKQVSKLNRSLEVIEGLITLADFEVINEFRNGLAKFRALVDFNPENKSLEQCGLVREQARKVLELLINDDLLIKSRKNAMSLQSRSGAPSTAQNVNTNKGNKTENNENIKLKKSAYAPPTIENMRASTQEIPDKPVLGNKTLFAGLKFKNDSNLGNEQTLLSSFTKKNDPLDIPSSKKNEKNNFSAIEHFPLQKIPKSQTKTELFGIPLKKHTTEKNIPAFSVPDELTLPIEPILENKADRMSNIGDFSLLSLEIESIQQSFPLPSIMKSPPDIFENLKSTQLKSENNNFMPDAFDLTDFPLINPAQKLIKSVPVDNLEAALMNIDGLESSLSLSKRPTFRK